jgi:hypothetical protein
MTDNIDYFDFVNNKIHKVYKDGFNYLIKNKCIDEDFNCYHFINWIKNINHVNCKYMHTTDLPFDPDSSIDYVYGKGFIYEQYTIK